MAKGIQARGERFRKKFIGGSSANRARRLRPIHSPTGMPSATARKKPSVTRNNDAVRSVASLPLRISSANARPTAAGEGNALSWNTRACHTKVQSSVSAANVTSGRKTLVVPGRQFTSTPYALSRGARARRSYVRSLYARCLSLAYTVTRFAQSP